MHIVDVQVDLSCVHARVLWEPMRDADAEPPLQAALERKTGILRACVNSYINRRLAVRLEFVPRSAAMPMDSPAQTTLTALDAASADLARAQRRRERRRGGGERDASMRTD